MKKKSHARAPDKKGFSVALPRDLIAAIEQLAKDETRTRNGQIQHLLEKAVADYKKNKRPFEVVEAAAKKSRARA